MDSVYGCGDCGYHTGRWMGFCPQCGAGALEQRSASMADIDVSTIAAEKGTPHAPTGLAEFDRVLGGGMVSGAAMLLGGEPGVGKSTLALQVAAAIVGGGRRVLIATAEETGSQVAGRARRVGAGASEIALVATGDVDRIVATSRHLGPDLLVVDSIQTVFAADIGHSGGSVSQVRECGTRLIGHGKDRRTAVILVGHVTKEGTLAGPKLLEHMVDVVLYLEGESNRSLRFLRALKNRFGPAREVGLFEMGSSGLAELPDPSGVLLSEHDAAVPGTVVFPTVEGRRPMLVEVQALVTASHTAQPRRSVTGLAASRVHQVLAVLQQHCGLSFTGKDVYVSIAGGARVAEPAADLPVAIALASSAQDLAVGDVAAWGELGLTGEVRSVPDEDRRRAEAERLSISRVVAPAGSKSGRIGDALRAAGLGAGAAARTPMRAAG